MGTKMESRLERVSRDGEILRYKTENQQLINSLDATNRMYLKVRIVLYTKATKTMVLEQVWVTPTLLYEAQRCLRKRDFLIAVSAMLHYMDGPIQSYL